MPTDIDVLNRLRLLVNGRTSLDEFEDWFLEHDLEADTNLQRQVAAVLAESAGNVEDEVAIRELATLLPLPLAIVGSGTMLSADPPILIDPATIPTMP